MTSLLSSQPLLCGPVEIRRKTCLVLLIFIVTASILLVLLNDDSDIQPKTRLKFISHNENSIRQNIIFNPMMFLNSRTVGPTCDSFLLIVITSAPQNADKRKLIRETWAKRNAFNNRYDWQYVFAVAKSDNETNQDRVAQEMNQYNDILYSDFKDTYRNLTTKVINAMAWAKTRCRYAKFFMKTDDDCYLNTVILPRLLQDHHTKATNLYLGRVFTEPRDLLVLRSEENRWSLNYEEYPEKYYPPYASGSGYLLSMDLVDAVLNRSRFMKPFPVEDAYFGVVLNALGVEPVHSGRFTLQSASWRVCNFLYLLVIHHVTPELQIKFNRMAVEAQTRCNEKLITKWN